MTVLDQFHEVWIPKAVETELQNLPEAPVRKSHRRRETAGMAEVARAFGYVASQLA